MWPLPLVLGSGRSSPTRATGPSVRIAIFREQNLHQGLNWDNVSNVTFWAGIHLHPTGRSHVVRFSEPQISSHLRFLSLLWYCLSCLRQCQDNVRMSNTMSSSHWPLYAKAPRPLPNRLTLGGNEAGDTKIQRRFIYSVSSAFYQ